jgi:DNA-binding NarL/FixJ family response regulator
MSQSGSVLCLSSDQSLCGALGAALGEHVVVRLAVDPAEALNVLSDVRWAALIVDTDTIDGHELEFLRAMRAATPILPTLVLAQRLSAGLINGAHGLRVELMAKPAELGEAVAFVQRSVASKGLSDDTVRAWTSVLITRHGLDEREADLFAYVLERETKDDVQRRWQVAEPIFQSHVRSLLRKCEVRTLDALSKRVLIHSVLYRVDPRLAEQSCELDLDDDPARAEAALSKAAV